MSARAGTSSRFLPREPDEIGAPLRLFCFHHAGGAASSFGDWRRALGPGVDVLPIQLPGREGRAREARAGELTELVAELDADLDPWLSDRPYVFYGHSMGALVAHALTRRRFEHDRTLPERLVVGACPAPHLRTPLDGAAERTDEELGRFLLDIGGMSPTLLRYPEWRRAAIALLRDDLRLCASDPHRGHPEYGARLPCPIEVFAGVDDPLVSLPHAAAWHTYTSARCRVHVQSGGHFFAQEPGAAFAARALAPLLRAPAVARAC
ncbi:alpha/beta fold hydrolase [Embleya sp. NBC_00888]|uniref:thioesterase II family protein n=1 Tax=Embleya sp. NBC_00888 TaxID=2975960 RepID=UPI00386C4358|nr:alpha/beta fold hydrolase [Embleya sp. NBC_00888]